MADESGTEMTPLNLPAEPRANCPSKKASCASQFWEESSQGQTTAFLKVDRIALRSGGVQSCRESGSLAVVPLVLINNSSKDHRGEASQALSMKGGRGGGVAGVAVG